MPESHNFWLTASRSPGVVEVVKKWSKTNLSNYNLILIVRPNFPAAPLNNVHAKT